MYIHSLSIIAYSHSRVVTLLVQEPQKCSEAVDKGADRVWMPITATHLELHSVRVHTAYLTLFSITDTSPSVNTLSMCMLSP